MPEIIFYLSINFGVVNKFYWFHFSLTNSTQTHRVIEVSSFFAKIKTERGKIMKTVAKLLIKSLLQHFIFAWNILYLVYMFCTWWYKGIRLVFCLFSLLPHRRRNLRVRALRTVPVFQWKPSKALILISKDTILELSKMEEEKGLL